MVIYLIVNGSTVTESTEEANKFAQGLAVTFNFPRVTYRGLNGPTPTELDAVCQWISDHGYSVSATTHWFCGNRVR